MVLYKSLNDKKLRNNDNLMLWTECGEMETHTQLAMMENDRATLENSLPVHLKLNIYLT